MTATARSLAERGRSDAEQDWAAGAVSILSIQGDGPYAVAYRKRHAELLAEMAREIAAEHLAEGTEA